MPNVVREAALICLLTTFCILINADYLAAMLCRIIETVI